MWLILLGIADALLPTLRSSKYTWMDDGDTYQALGQKDTNAVATSFMTGKMQDQSVLPENEQEATRRKGRMIPLAERKHMPAHECSEQCAWLLMHKLKAQTRS